MENTTKQTPPYLPKTKLEEVFKFLSTRSFNVLNPDDFVNRGFSKADAFQVIASLKFLNILQSDGTKTENLTKLQLMGEERMNAIKNIIQSGYQKLFSTAPEANKLSREELHNEFIAVYGISPRIARTAVPAFIWLCKEAGIEISVDTELRQRKPISKSRTTAKNLTVIKKTASYNEAPRHSEGYEVPFRSIKLIIPDTDKARSILWSDEFKKIADQLIKLSDSMTGNSNEVGSGGLAEGQGRNPGVPED